MKHHLSDPFPFTRTVRALALLAPLLALSTINHQLSTAQAQGTAFTYQGRLTAGGNVAQGIYDLRFAIYDAQSGGNAVGGPLTNSAVSVSNGLFTVALDFGVGIFAGESRWLAIGVRTNGGGSFSTLPGRQPLTPSPYAIHAADALTATSAATATTASSVAAGSVNTAALAENAVTSDKIADGTIASADISTGGIDAGRIVGGDLQAARLKVGSGHALGGTLATIAGGSNNTANAVGDAVGGGWWNRAEGGYSVVGGGEANTANGYHAAVLGGWQNKATNDYATVAGGAWNYAGGPGAVVGGGGWDGLTLVGNVASGGASTVGGGSGNTASGLSATVGGGGHNTASGTRATVGGGFVNSATEYGATVAGGHVNQATNGYATVGGGYQNTAGSGGATVGGGEYNSADGLMATIGGGNQNKIQTNAYLSTIGGGYENEIRTNAYMSTIGGGDNNAVQVNADHASIGGGGYNTVNGAYASIPGGQQNVATSYGFAAGRRAKAVHTGSLVWADSTDADFASTGANQFLIRAGGGVGIGTDAPQAQLHVAGDTVVEGTNFTAVGHTAQLVLGDGNHVIRSIYGAGLRLGVWPDPFALSIQDVTANVGIGTTNPVAKLEVVGTVRAGSFQGDGSALTGIQVSAANLGGGTVTSTINFNPPSGAPFTVGNQNLVGGLNADFLDGWHSTHYWQLGGNSSVGAGDFIGTTANQPLEFKVNSQRAMRLEPTPTNGAVNLILGSPGNVADPGVVAATIGGGGTMDYYGSPEINRVRASYATIAGGVGHTIDLNAYGATICGGHVNAIGEWGRCGTIAGGVYNEIKTDAYAASVGGGQWNRVGMNADWGTIGGGKSNTIETEARYAGVSGGYENTIQTNAACGTISGGSFNTIWQNATNAVISGGRGNAIDRWGESSAVGGGESNRTEAARSTIAGGSGNLIQDHNAEGSTISGGVDNQIERSPYSAIAGGISNTITITSGWSAIGGGEGNRIVGNAHYCTIGGGTSNTIHMPAEIATIAGGSFNTVGGSISTVGGGHANVIDYSAIGSTIPGGESNVVAAGASYAFAAGQRAKANHTGAFVWADSTDADFASTRNDEFNIRAAGGVRVESGLGIGLNADNRPLITRGYDPFTSGAYTGLGRWGLFMEPFRLAIGIADLPGRYFEVAKYATDGTSVSLLTLDQAGNLNIRGSYGYLSDRNAKENFKPVDSRDVLEKVAALPIARWNFKQETGVAHLGPVAQDFHAAFGLGADDKHIATVDADGVALAAIQGLNEKVESGKQKAEGRMEQMEEQVREKDARIAALEQRLSTLENLIKSTMQKGN